MERNGSKRRRRVRETAKDVLIIALAASAVYLALRTQLSSDLDGAGGFWGGVAELFNGASGALQPQNGEENQPLEIRPMRIAVNVDGENRYAIQYDQGEADRVFNGLFSLLGEGLGSAGEPVKVGETAFRDALSHRPGVYFDFQGRVPLASLHAWLESGGENPALPEADVRRVLLAADGQGGAALYYSNESDGSYYACGTSAALAEHLLSSVAEFSGNGAQFAYELPGEEHARLGPYVLLGISTPTPRVYRAGNPMGGMDEERGELLTALGFHPQTNSGFRSGSRLRFREGGDDLTVDDGGAVVYHSAAAEEAKYPVPMAGEAPTHAELAAATSPIAEGTVGAAKWCGAARLYLIGVTETGDGGWWVDYGYSLDGAPVQAGASGRAARFTVRDGRVTDFELYMRYYEAAEETSIVLPEVLAAAAMESLDAGGRELVLSYEDTGAAEPLRAEWIAVGTE